MTRFHLHICNATDRTRVEDEAGAEYDSLEHAYLAAFAGAQEIWAELLPRRQDPRCFTCEIADASGTVLMTLPFSEVLDSCHGPKWRKDPTGPIDSALAKQNNAHEELSDEFRQLLLKCQGQVALSRQTIERSRALVRESRLLRSRIVV